MDFNFNIEIPTIDILGTSNDCSQKPTIQDVRSVSHKLKNRHFCRRLLSEHQLESVVEWDFEDGASYHFLSQGDIDSFSFLKFILRQQSLEYLISSTWCMAEQDVLEFENYYNLGRIQKLDFYVGEIFPGTYCIEYSKLSKLVNRCGGRIAVFRNHSKVFVGFGSRFDFVIEGSANINTNPRCENTCITLDSNLANFYKDFYDGIVSFQRDFDGWKPSIITIKNRKNI